MSDLALSSQLYVGNVQLRNRVALAPMAGLTDVPFRTIAWRFGAGHMVSEMVASKLELWNTQKSQLRRIAVAGSAPMAVQMAGNDPQVMAETARRLTGEGAALIDINFGCPAKKVCRRAAGSALLADLDRIANIVEAVSAAATVPVTVKTRTGLEIGDEYGVEAAIAAEQAGARMVVMHGRSRACRFVGPVRFQPVRNARRRVSIPVLVNGDITDAASAARALQLTGADGVMVGRGAIGQPWIFQVLAGGELPSISERLQVMSEHLAHMHQFYGLQQGVRIARKHIQAYLQKLHVAQLVPSFMSLDTAFEQMTWLNALSETQIIALQQDALTAAPVLANSAYC
jgi:tRNA-dihydrouridine synthase B